MKNVNLPSGFTELRIYPHVWWIKKGWEQVFPLAFSSFSTPTTSASIFTPTGGRSFLQRLPLPDGSAAIIRRYHRGGLIRYFTHDLYWERPFRPLTELRHTETARQRQVPTIEVLAAAIEHIALGLYKGLFISREAEGFVNLWEWLQSAPSSEERCAGIASVARAIDQLHKIGFCHADLNLTNILITAKDLNPHTLIIDFDRARIFPASVPFSQRKKNLQRLRRSLQKLDPHAQYSSPTDLQTFCRFYHASRTSSAA